MLNWRPVIALKSRYLPACWLLILLCAGSSGIVAGTHFGFGAEWLLFKGRQEASTPDTSAWRTPGFNDAAWSLAPSPLYYGLARTGGTVLTDMRNQYSSIYLRKHFSVVDPASIATLDLDVVCDDGFVAWLNGTIVAHKLRPADPITFNSRASGFAEDPAVVQTYPISNPNQILLAGENILAVQVFNADITSSDLLFDAQLISTRPATVLPVLKKVTPQPGPVTSLTQVTVEFSEPVQGVEARDLRVNDLACTNLAGAGSIYTFYFAQPAAGPVQFSWGIDANITDLKNPPNFFDPSGANSTFVYTLLDPAPPVLAEVHPPIGSTVKVLGQLDLTFSKSVIGVDAADLRVNGLAAKLVSGAGKGPYSFTLPPLGVGPVQVTWSANHGISDNNIQPNLFAATQGWTYTYDTNLNRGFVRISEILADDETVGKQDWIELHNPSRGSVNLNAWSLTDDPATPGKWVFPDVTIPAGGRLLVYASGRDIRAGSTLHTNFKLSTGGEYLGLYTPDSPRQMVSEFRDYPEQRHGISYGFDGTQFGYFETPTPATANGVSTVTNIAGKVYFSVQRGFFDQPFSLSLSTTTPGATIRYTIDGSEPNPNSPLYTGLIQVTKSTVVRATAFKQGHLPSIPETHTYLFNLPAHQRAIPVVSLVTGTNNLYGTNGIMEVEPRNTTKHGIAWERPVSMELIKPQDNSGFQINAGLRVAGGDYVRELYNYRDPAAKYNKYSFRVSFRGDYGADKLEYPFFPHTTHRKFDAIHFRAGIPEDYVFVTDPLMHRLHATMGHVASDGTFVNLFINGEYKGYYNPVERIDKKFLQNWYGGTNEWDVIGAYNEVSDGDDVEWNKLRALIQQQDPALPAVYQQIEQQMDLVNFVDYLLPMIYGDADDWPHNNTRSARERTPGAKWRFYVWDAEYSLGIYDSPADRNTITNQLSNLNPPWGTSDYQQFFLRLQRNPEFRLLFADRIHKHFFNGGKLTDENIAKEYYAMIPTIHPAMPLVNDEIIPDWIAARRRYVTNHFAQANLIVSSNAPYLSRFGGRVHKGFDVSLTAPAGTIYYTVDGTDPRVPFTAAINPSALAHNNLDLVINRSFQLKARTLLNGIWSALTETEFSADELGIPLRFTEIMYNPPGGDAYEFLEIINYGGLPLDLAGITLDGVTFQFPAGSPLLQAGARVVLASSVNPSAFAQRYPSVTVTGFYKGALANGGERIALKDPAGNIITAVDYDDENGWARAADGNGYSLEIISPDLDSNGAANWRASSTIYGSPGVGSIMQTASSPIRLNEFMAENVSAVKNGLTYPDWIELFNSGSSSVDLSGWALSDDANSLQFVFPAGTTIAAEGYLVVWCDSDLTAPGLHSRFSLGRKGESLFLYDQSGLLVDSVSYGLQPANYSVARETNNNWKLSVPTPTKANESIALGTLDALAINEVLPNAFPGFPDWVELFNGDSQSPLDLSGIYLGLSNAVSRLPQLSFLEPGGYLQLFADEAAGNDHLNFKLPAGGARLSIYDGAGAELLNFYYGALPENVSAGLFPDGSGPLTTFPSSPSPGAKNYIPSYTGPFINEVLAYNGSRTENGRLADWIELYNPGSETADLGGITVSLNNNAAADWTFPPGTFISPDGYLRVWFDPNSPVSFDAAAGFNAGVELNNTGATIYLVRSGSILQALEYGFQVPDLSFGRAGVSYQLLAQPTPQGPNGNAASLGSLDSVRFNEWMVASYTGDDWFELHNSASLPVELTGSFLTDDPSSAGRTNFQVGALSFIAPSRFVLFQADGEVNRGNDHVPFKLNSLGETLRLYAPNQALIDEVNFLVQAEGISEGRAPDGSDNLALFVGTASPGASNITPSNDQDGDGLPDEWEASHGLLQNDPADAVSDPDGDGQSNLDEYRAGTNPKDASSALALHVPVVRVVPATEIVLSFEARPGKSYTILYKDNLSEETPWLKLANIDAQPIENSPVILDTTPDGTKRFYRVVTPKLP